MNDNNNEYYFVITVSNYGIESYILSKNDLIQKLNNNDLIPPFHSYYPAGNSETWGFGNYIIKVDNKNLIVPKVKDWDL